MGVGAGVYLCMLSS